LSSKVGRAPRPSLPSGYRVGPAVGGAAVGQVPVHRRPGHLEGVGDLLHGVLAVVVHRSGLRDLVGCHLELRAALAPAGPGRGEPVVGAFDDQVVLELGDRGEHVEEQPATRGGGVDALGQRPQPDVKQQERLATRVPDESPPRTVARTWIVYETDLPGTRV